MTNLVGTSAAQFTGAATLVRKRKTILAFTRLQKSTTAFREPILRRLAEIVNAIVARLEQTPEYYVTAAETSAGVTIVDYKRMPTPIRDISRYVSDNTGATDVTSEMQAAFDVSDSFVIIPEGTYKISSALTFDTGYIIQGAGRGKTIISNAGGSTVDAFTNTAGVRGAVIQNLTIQGQAGSRDGIRFTADFGHVQLIDLAIIAVGSGINASAGNGIDIYMRNVRSYGETYGFNFDASGGTAINNITAMNCYCAGSDNTATPTAGWNFANVTAALTDCSSDLNATAYILGGNILMIGCTAESNTTKGANIAGTGNITLIGFKTVSEQLPIIIDAAAHVTVINPRTTGTVGSNSIELSASATGINLLLGENFDGAVSINSSAKLTRIRDESINFNSDTNLYRSAADTLKSDDNLHIDKDLIVQVGTAASKVQMGAQGPSGQAGFRVGSSPVTWIVGSGSPESAVTANPGSWYSNSAGGAGTSFYVKESGTGNTGWVAK